MSDLVDVGPELAPGVFPFVRHREDGSDQQGIARAAREGEPLDGDDMILEPTESPRRYRATSVRELLGGSGPAQVATEEYRSGWESIFGKRREVAEA